MMRRFNYLKRTFLFALALTLTNCQVDETPTEQQSRIETVTINEAKTLLIQPSTAKFSKLSKEELSNLEFDKISQEKINGSDQLLTIIPYATNNKTINKRILLLRIDKEIKSVVFSMYPEENSQKDHFSGKIFTYSLDGDFINGFRAKNGIIVSQFVKNNNAIKTNTENGKASKSMHRSAVQLNEVIIQNNYHTVDALDVYGSSSIFGSGLFDGDFGNYYGGGDTSYSWDPGAESADTATISLPPSCESFNFTSKPGSQWQESAVINIHFNIIVITTDGYHFSQIIEYPNAILFGVPTNLSIGNTTIGPGLAATLSAKAVEVSMSETVSMYGNKPVSALTVRLYFEERLKYNYPLFIPGGRVNFNSSSFSVTPTQYKTNMFGTGNCN
ncbi:hypothetical protein CLU83_3328 [Flavobacterium sp. 1]|uniref:hypothetical protein n=1 Tax=Flavobacterium sp. 1 TaxID=2035200 RepID=UPI000CC0C0EF|nr:hypothetical protein [Flavobacterium sp. 1]PJJ09945.1 hypothetical protein CLU83_3328 [Flavobacterium sp. 1]